MDGTTFLPAPMGSIEQPLTQVQQSSFHPVPVSMGVTGACRVLSRRRRGSTRRANWLCPPVQSAHKGETVHHEVRQYYQVLATRMLELLQNVIVLLPFCRVCLVCSRLCMPVVMPVPCFHRCLGIAVAIFALLGQAFLLQVPVAFDSTCRSMQMELYVCKHCDLLSHCCCPYMLE